ncbi:MAG: hypothetical protein E7465_00820 [Ruminococcaceae bacterium]|nr:hypothetical protein [Oscillospiraceae bacterium]
MKQLSAIFLAVILLAVFTACTPEVPVGESSAPAETTGPEILTGWQEIGGRRYCFDSQGNPRSGWITEEGQRYFLDENGMALTGWQDLDGKRYYFGDSCAMTVGWAQLDGGHYYFGIDGSMFRGLLNIEGKGYYFSDSGLRYSGWLELDGKTYYFGPEGEMAVGPVEIDGQTHHFSPHGVKILLVNPWNPLPKDYEVELVDITYRDRMAVESSEALIQMLADCEAAGHETMIVSAYRTQEDQEFLFNRKVNSYLSLNWSRERAETEAAKEVAVPGTSEHQLGLAVDIIDVDYGYLDDHQANMPAQKWLMEHCHEYGFILRYPVGSTEITGIIYEPWHYRYVGVEIAQEITNLGITLEEYLGAA